MRQHHQSMPLDQIFKEAWLAVNGTKFACFVTFLVLIITQLIIYFISTLSMLVLGNNWINNAFHFVLSGIFIAPLLTGLMMIGVQRFHAPHHKISWSAGLKYYRMVPKLFMAFIIDALLLWLVFMVFILAGLFALSALHGGLRIEYTYSWTLAISIVYFMVIFMVYNSLILFNYILVADKGVHPFISWWASCKMAWLHFGKVLLALFYILIFNILGLCLLGVGLIWTIPWTYLIIGRMYLFCVRDHDLSEDALVSAHLME